MSIFNEKVAIITGGASGIGRALGRELARRGAKVVLADINGSLLKEAVDSLTNDGYKAKAATVDVTDREAVQKLVDGAVAEYGRLDFMFNNAGIGVGGMARDFSYEDWKKVVDINLYGVIHGVVAAYPVMIKQGFGHIINTASLAGLVVMPGEISYTASKFAIVGLSNVLRIEAERLGVRVSVVCPGLIQTPIYRTSKVVKMDREKGLSMLPKGISAEECAAVILRGIERNKAIIVVTGFAKFLWILQRISPSLVLWLGKVALNRLRSEKIIE